MYAASAIAVNTVVRSAAASAAPLFTNQMFTALGVGGGGSLVGGVGALLAVIPFAFYRYGGRIRVRSRFAPTTAGAPAPGDGADRAEKGEGVAGDGQASGAEERGAEGGEDSGSVDGGPLDHIDGPVASTHHGGEQPGEAGG